MPAGMEWHVFDALHIAAKQIQLTDTVTDVTLVYYLSYGAYTHGSIDLPRLLRMVTHGWATTLMMYRPWANVLAFVRQIKVPEPNDPSAPGVHWLNTI